MIGAMDSIAARTDRMDIGNGNGSKRVGSINTGGNHWTAQRGREQDVAGTEESSVTVWEPSWWR